MHFINPVTIYFRSSKLETSERYGEIKTRHQIMYNFYIPSCCLLMLLDMYAASGDVTYVGAHRSNIVLVNYIVMYV